MTNKYSPTFLLSIANAAKIPSCITDEHEVIAWNVTFESAFKGWKVVVQYGEKPDRRIVYIEQFISPLGEIVNYFDMECSPGRESEALGKLKLFQCSVEEEDYGLGEFVPENIILRRLFLALTVVLNAIYLVIASWFMVIIFLVMNAVVNILKIFTNTYEDTCTMGLRLSLVCYRLRTTCRRYW